MAVVGAGPAGSAAALEAKRNDPSASVILVDRQSFPRDKACGDGVAPHVIEELRRFGLENAYADFAPTHELQMGTRTSSRRRRLQRELRAIPRAVFDARLVEAAIRAGLVFRQLQVDQFEVRPDFVRLTGAISAKTVIAADGVESTIRRTLGIPLNRDGHMALAIRGYAPTSNKWARLVSRGKDWPAYAWEFPLGNGTSNVGYGEVLRKGKTLNKAILIERLNELMPGTGDRASDWRGARIPLSTWRPRQPSGRVLLVGDAASLVNPMSGEGIYYAVRSGVLAAQASLAGNIAGEAYRLVLHQEFSRHLRHTSAMARLGSLGGLVAVGTRMTVVDDDFFDDEVEVSIAGGTYRLPVLFKALARALVGRQGIVRERMAALR